VCHLLKHVSLGCDNDVARVLLSNSPNNSRKLFEHKVSDAWSGGDGFLLRSCKLTMQLHVSLS
jgi:hypothetical protein